VASGGLRVLGALFGVLALLDAGVHYTLEDGRRSAGRVVSGVVLERLSSSGENGTRRIGGKGMIRRGDHGMVVTGGFRSYDYAVRILATGSTDAWVIDYRYGCSIGINGTCFGRDFVEHDLWTRLRAGQYVNVRQGRNETRTSRLDGNSSWRPVIAKFAISAALLGFVWFTGPPGRRRRRTSIDEDPPSLAEINERLESHPHPELHLPR